eukprot:5589243-Prymnesium_polylepis.1
MRQRLQPATRRDEGCGSAIGARGCSKVPQARPIAASHISAGAPLIRPHCCYGLSLHWRHEATRPAAADWSMRCSTVHCL